ncbi:GDSL esterase/lipase At5g37690-like [Bidens hawaiensis]|uniref:GDSL esterase/lipase At5g37690-like n=1 Tax=Bidens hawaiensis TaxID=980011 RepID=UPI0040490A34
MVNSNITVSNVKAMYIMGDSTVDCGENTLFFPYLLRNLSLHPCEGPHSSILPHLLAKKIGLSYPIPFYSQNGSSEVLERGINLGSTGATILSNPTTPLFQSLNQQLRQVFEIFQLLQLELSQETTNEFIRNSTLFYISFGKDDYINLFRSKSANGPGSDAEKLSRILVDQMTNAIEYLYDSNVRKFVFMGILPLGCAPRFLHATNGSAADEVVCAADINNFVLEYNAFLEQRIVRLGMKLSDAQLIFCDFYRPMMEIINNPSTYGMTETIFYMKYANTYDSNICILVHFAGIKNVKNACCGEGTDSGLRGCMSMNMACADPSTHVWWDQFNPGLAVSSLIADSAWSGELLRDICRPTTVQNLVSSV